MTHLHLNQYMKLKTKIFTFLITSASLQASVTLSPTAENIQDSSGAAVSAGRLALIVVSTGDSTFGPIFEGGLSLNISSGGMGFIDNDDDAVIQHFATDINGFTSISQASSSGVTLNLDSRFTPGDNFAIYWFPTIVFDSDIANITLTEGDSYGLVSAGIVQNDGSPEGNGFKDWVLPSDGNSPVQVNSSPGFANLRVQAIPEPSSVALLGLGAVGLISRRRRD